ncbi:hypothetical protein CHLRE_02g079003v5 [Chlamydomonas reinhardtii]|uniref:Uncharacterized protein n=1 Tax=Chlamydomonas reinhardtii TaxID=3055 RepID=A0A2K3E0G8_CHLRE|nr:uncharacterized protein CHLRE_02g079003v5 [Chlamydomonas reinhardtii]PNW86259.1 hypothetical protein CHLRE_02g079003v5 [Chlamydomonas reinhardtii]
MVARHQDPEPSQGLGEERQQQLAPQPGVPSASEAQAEAEVAARGSREGSGGGAPAGGAAGKLGDGEEASGQPLRRLSEVLAPLLVVSAFGASGSGGSSCASTPASATATTSAAHTTASAVAAATAAEGVAAASAAAAAERACARQHDEAAASNMIGATPSPFHQDPPASPSPPSSSHARHHGDVSPFHLQRLQSHPVPPSSSCSSDGASGDDGRRLSGSSSGSSRSRSRGGFLSGDTGFASTGNGSTSTCSGKGCKEAAAAPARDGGAACAAPITATTATITTTTATAINATTTVAATAHSPRPRPGPGPPKLVVMTPRDPPVPRPPPGVRQYTDGRSASYVLPLPYRLLAQLTLGLYVGFPYILLGLLLGTAAGSRAAAAALALTLGSLLVPAPPHIRQGMLDSALFRLWRAYFNYSYAYDQLPDFNRPHIFVNSPHGAFPLSQILCISLSNIVWPGFPVHSLAASVLWYIPLWRHMKAALGAAPASRDNARMLLRHRGWAGVAWRGV